jgi:hypothetical protein
MKASLLFSVFLVFLNCTTKPSSENQSVTKTDTTSGIGIAVADTLAYDTIIEDFNEPPDQLSDSLQESVQNLVAALRDKPGTTTYYINASVSGYEHSFDATYYFDSLLSLTSCSISWSMEGTSGSGEYYFIEEELAGGEEKIYYNDSEEEIWIYKSPEHYGFTRTMGTDSDSVNPLGESEYNEKRNEIWNDFEKLLSRVRENEDAVGIGEKRVTIHLENVVEYGEEFIETEDYDMDRVVYDQLVKGM